METRAAPAGVTFRPLEERDAAVMTALRREADDTAVTSEAGWLNWWKGRKPREQRLELAAEADGRVVAIGVSGLDLSTSVAGASWASVVVTEAYRRQGVGTALHDRLLDHLRAVGAGKASSFMRGTEEGERWANARGWTRQLAGPLIALDPRDAPEPTPPEGFRCVSMDEFGDPRAAFELVRVAILDEPRPVPADNLEYDEFIRQWEDPDLDRDASALVLHGDRPVAFAFVRVGGSRASHGGTATLPDYRGRGLATAAKCFLLRAVAAKGVTLITTSNAEENAPIRAINRKLGFKPIGEHVIVGRDV
jgi:GNAT superfamily N-acetyltransferase